MAGGNTGTPIEPGEIAPEVTGGITGLPVLLSEQVTLTLEDFVQPAGELYDSLFPEQDLYTLVDGWLQQAIYKVEGTATIPAEHRNLAASAWVYYRAYSHIAQRLMASAATMNVDGKVSRTIASDQRQHFADLATAKLTMYEQLSVPTVTAQPKAAAYFGVVKARRYVQ